ncbi:hypothetical protein [Actinokineospora sp. HUAS TT18]|uniref:hypothetical protein n=1 Tax=Actinokineospora sp. HUAS TT18 TaxID=3447451 RepID=UPI003F51F667
MTVLAGAIAALLVSTTGVATAASTPTIPAGCKVWLRVETGSAFGSCDSTVTRPWRVLATYRFTSSSGKMCSQFDLSSPKEITSGGPWFEPRDPYIEFYPAGQTPPALPPGTYSCFNV